MKPSGEAIAALLDGTHADPFSLLGIHEGPEGAFARAVLPGAETAEAHDLSGKKLGKLKCTDDCGLFEGKVKGGRQPVKYHCKAGAHDWWVTDAYSFGPVLGPLDDLLIGLREVHTHKLLHLDIKPANIYIRNDGIPVLLDFGAARQTLIKDAPKLKLVQLLSAGYDRVDIESIVNRLDLDEIAGDRQAFDALPFEVCARLVELARQPVALGSKPGDPGLQRLVLCRCLPQPFSLPHRRACPGDLYCPAFCRSPRHSFSQAKRQADRAKTYGCGLLSHTRSADRTRLGSAAPACADQQGAARPQPVEAVAAGVSGPREAYVVGAGLAGLSASVELARAAAYYACWAADAADPAENGPEAVTVSLNTNLFVYGTLMAAAFGGH